MGREQLRITLNRVNRGWGGTRRSTQGQQQAPQAKQNLLTPAFKMLLLAVPGNELEDKGSQESSVNTPASSLSCCSHACQLTSDRTMVCPTLCCQSLPPHSTPEPFPLNRAL